MKKDNSELNEVKVYRYKVYTFRRTLEFRIGWDKEYFDREYSDLWFDYNLTSWFYYFNEENNCNIIWMRDYNLNTLVHELVHCIENMADQVWLEMSGEPIAYMYEELFTKIWNDLGTKFKLDRDTKKYFNS